MLIGCHSEKTKRSLGPLGYDFDKPDLGLCHRKLGRLSLLVVGLTRCRLKYFKTFIIQRMSAKKTRRAVSKLAVDIPLVNPYWRWSQNFNFERNCGCRRQYFGRVQMASMVIRMYLCVYIYIYLCICIFTSTSTYTSVRNHTI